MKYRITKAFPHLYLDRGGRKDEDGIRKERWRYRPPGGKAVTIKGKFGSPEFAASYRAAVEGLTEKMAADPKGTMKALIEKYMRSPEYVGTAKLTKAGRGPYLRYLLEKCGAYPVAKLERKYVKAILEPYAGRPGAYDSVKRMLSVLMNFAIEDGLIDHNPAQGLKGGPKLSEEGFHPWSPEERAQYEAFYPIGTIPRLAYDLALYTGQRVSDLVRMGPRHVKVIDGRRYIAVHQQKTKVDLDIPIWPELQDVIDATPSIGLTFITGMRGHPLKGGQILTKYMTQWARAAGLTNCTAHGLRKSCCTVLAQHGCTDHEIMAISGHTSMKEVQRYTKSVNQRLMAERAMAKSSYPQNVVKLPTREKTK